MIVKRPYSIFVLLFLFYAVTFYIFGTGHEILKGNVSIFGTDFSKLTMWAMLLMLFTVGIPLLFADLDNK